MGEHSVRCRKVGDFVVEIAEARCVFRERERDETAVVEDACKCSDGPERWKREKHDFDHFGA